MRLIMCVCLMGLFAVPVVAQDGSEQVIATLVATNKVQSDKIAQFEKRLAQLETANVKNADYRALAKTACKERGMRYAGVVFSNPPVPLCK